MNLLAGLAAELQRLSEPDPARPPRPARCPRCYSADAGSRGRGTRHARVVGAQSPMSNGEVGGQAFAVELGRDGSAMHKHVFRDGVGGLLALSESEGGVRGAVCLCLAADVDSASPTPHSSFAPLESCPRVFRLRLRSGHASVGYASGRTRASLSYSMQQKRALCSSLPYPTGATPQGEWNPSAAGRVPAMHDGWRACPIDSAPVSPELLRVRTRRWSIHPLSDCQPTQDCSSDRRPATTHEDQPPYMTRGVS